MAEKSERPKGLYGRLLEEKRLLPEKEAEEGSEGKPLAPSRLPDSRVLKELEEKAIPARPGYMRDLRSLHSLIEHGGPDNCASSMWFRSLKDQYPAEYEMLKAEHLGEGKSLQEGFRHGRRFAREQLEHLDVNEDLILFVGYEEYGFFMHEADVLLWALGCAVEKGDLTLDGLRECWQPYRRLWPTLYKANLQEWEEHLWPSLEGDHDTPVTTAFFMREAENLNIPNAGYLGSYSMSTGDIFEVRGADALAALQEALRGSYRLAPEKNLNYTSIGPQEAMRLFEETLMSPPEAMRLFEDPHERRLKRAEPCKRIEGAYPAPTTL